MPKTDKKTMEKTRFVMTLKKEGKHVAHYVTGVEEGGVPAFFKDGYTPHELFTELGKQQEITVTIEPGDTLNG